MSENAYRVSSGRVPIIYRQGLFIVVPDDVSKRDGLLSGYARCPRLPNARVGAAVGEKDLRPSD